MIFNFFRQIFRLIYLFCNNACIPRLHYTRFIGMAWLKSLPVPNLISAQATNAKAEHI